MPGEGKPKEFADRSLSPAQWEEIETHLAQLPLDLVRMRLEVLFVLGKELGMRASEMINARCGWIEYSRFGDEETVVIDIVGKGDKQRRLPLSSEQVEKISRYLAARKRPPLFKPAGKDVPLIASFRIGNKGADKEGLSRSGLYIVLHTFLEEVANDVRKKNPRDAAKLLGSSLHWLRHTFAVASLEVMPVNVVQTAMGHASVNTTTRYISPDQTEVLEGFKKLKS
ncbi:MAG: tyrosine-type recombinase/integrase [Parasutterella sp.]|uniref:tyrosine-type recombinase/integrase n=1 Tax=Parasutterella sp. TaxID=2049037 RepID=UPI00300F2C17